MARRDHQRAQQPRGIISVAPGSPFGRGPLLLVDLDPRGLAQVNATGRPFTLTRTATSGETDSVSTGNLGPVRGYGVLTAQSGPLYTFPAATLNAFFSASGEATFLAVLRGNGTGDAAGNQSGIVTRNAGFNEHYPLQSNGLIYAGPFAGERWVGGVAPVVTMTVPHVIIATHKSGSQAYYQAGRLLASASRVETPAMNATTAGIAGAGATFRIIFWDRILTPGEIAAYSRNPWQIGQRRQRRQRYVIPTTPTLSLPTAFNITATTVTPRVTVTF